MILLFVASSLPFPASGQAREGRVTKTGDHVQGWIKCKDVEFEIDAILVDSMVRPGIQVHFIEDSLSNRAVLDALSAVFLQEDAGNLEVSKGRFYLNCSIGSTPYAHKGFVRHLPYGACYEDDRLSSLRSQAHRFLEECDVSHGTIPLTLGYCKRSLNKQHLIPTSDVAGVADEEAYVELTFCSSYQGMEVMPNLSQPRRIGGEQKIEEGENTYVSSPLCTFLFDKEGNLLFAEGISLKVDREWELEGRFISWEDALYRYGNELAGDPYLSQNVFQHVKYVVTDIRSVWMTDGGNTAVPGWYFMLSGYDMAEENQNDSRWQAGCVAAYSDT